jgi:soluble lytic murein transglycosylase-like protein
MKRAVMALLMVFAMCSECAVAQQYKQSRIADSVRVRAKLYEPLIASTARRYRIDPHLLWTIAYLESRFRNDVISYKNGRPCAYGMMQFTGPTASRYGLTNPHDPQQAIDAAARYVRDLQRRFGSRGDLILAAYNAGEGTVEAFRGGIQLVLPNNKVINPHRLRTDGIPPYEETRNYIAFGQMIYRNISRTNFPGSNSIDNSTQEHQQIDPPLVDTARQDSFYTSDSSTQRNIRRVTKSPTVAPTNSLYVN